MISVTRAAPLWDHVSRAKSARDLHTATAQVSLQIHNKKLFDLENECQSDGAQ